MAHSGFKDLLKNGGFQAFLWTQFLGAFNDNAYRIIVSLRAVHIIGSADQSGKYLALAGAIFVLPSLLFAGYSGHLADAISKRTVLISVKAFEILVMTIGIFTFFTNSVPWMFLVLFLMAVHSTVFSPAKYSIVPEIVPNRDLSRANALLEMSTLVAIVLGTSVGPVPVFGMEGRSVEGRPRVGGRGSCGFPGEPEDHARARGGGERTAAPGSIC